MSRVAGAALSALTVLVSLVIVAAIGLGVVWGVRAIVFSDASERIFTQGSEPEPLPEWAEPAEALSAADDGSSGGFLERVDPDWLAETAARTEIPERALNAYAAADLQVRSDQGCAVGWNTLAGIGWVESHHGTLQEGRIDSDGIARPEIIGVPLDGTDGNLWIPDTDNGELDGDTEFDRAVGPLQFIPETWQIFGADAHGRGEPNPHSIDDAALTAAVYMCRLDGNLETASSWIEAVRSYNDSEQYQRRVAQAAESYAEDASF